MGVIIVVGSVMAVLKTVINHTGQIMEHGSAEVNGIPIVGRKKHSIQTAHVSSSRKIIHNKFLVAVFTSYRPISPLPTLPPGEHRQSSTQIKSAKH